ncbi:hypothetical protein HanLR1_Chr00c1825g0821741 [Helianthus annuus]|nr:hypothetical protein HanHA89_Chr11g0449481 [Helianthus annuus]KAJ0803477.1 hypothetical protein HanLR1_Chr00c1825g0821741 [Helianthus annuus]
MAIVLNEAFAVLSDPLSRFLYDKIKRKNVDGWLKKYAVTLKQFSTALLPMSKGVFKLSYHNPLCFS